MKRRKRLAFLALGAVLTACSPAQLATLERLTGVSLDAETRKVMLDAPDVPIGVAAGEIMADGSLRPWQAPAGSKCPEWYGPARLAGWPASDWERLDVVIWRESRCDPGVYNGKGRDDSRGLLQINTKAGSGNRPFIGPLVGNDWDSLFDPATNLWVGRRMFEYWQANSWSKRCGWWGWSTKGSGWCK
jgi:hypothetical protein